MNNTLKAITSRYSCRAFTDQIPTDAQLTTIAEASLASPSAMNRQPWRVIVVKDRKLIDEMDNEALHFIAAYEDKTMYNRRPRKTA